MASPTRRSAASAPSARSGETERRERQPQRMAADDLRRVAVAHLQRFPCSVSHLRQVLRRKIRRSARHYGDDETPLLEAAEAVIAALDGGPLLDDRRYAGALVESLHRRGRSQRAIRQKLRQKGIADELAGEAVAALAEGPGDPDLRAAVRYARRRRLGPFQRDAARRIERREKDLAALGRQGFGYGIARQVIDAEDPADLPQ